MLLSSWEIGIETLPLLIIPGLRVVTLQAFAIDQEFSSAPENVGNGPYHYTDNTLQTQFTIPVVVAIVSIVVGIAIYYGARSK